MLRLPARMQSCGTLPYVMTSQYEKIMTLKDRLDKTALKFNPVLSAGTVEKFETENRIILPADYKLFIQYIGNGGDGPPEYGIKPIGTDEIWWSDAQKKAWTFENIRKPFPFSEQWIWEGDEAENTELQDRIFDGNIYLGTDGCGMDWTLIISGGQQGFVWQITDVGISPCRPPMTFLQWFTKWLDHDPSSPDPFWWTD